MVFCEVIVDIAHSEVDKIFDYACDFPVKEGTRVVVPFGFGNSTTTGFVVRVKDSSDCPSEKLKRIYRADVYAAINAECLQLAKKLAARYRCPLALCLRLFLPSEMRTGKASETYRTYARLSGAEAEIAPRAKMQLALIEYLREKGEEDAARLRERFGGAVNALAEKGVITLEKRRYLRNPYQGVTQSQQERTLTPSQAQAVKTVTETEKTVTLIHGVTGSGKTEIYLTLIARALEEGRTAIFLVPEISLTPQMLAQLRARFGAQAAIIHSGLSAGERFDEWQRLRSGEARIAIGARSAVFTPLENIGIIIVDEEHDGSYSSETSPRYNTFDVALLRAQYNGAKLVLGSATPSVETYRRAKEGEFGLITLKDRINARPMPEVELVDMRREVKRGNPSAFSAHLKQRLEACLESGNQAILFLNRRGYSQTVICRDCGYVAKCKDCDIALTYHSEEKCLKCHYCGLRYKTLSVCPECGGVHLGYMGTGTQKIVEELKKLYPAARILRMDVDTTGGKEGHYKILSRFAKREADILVGTQMVAKGHDFPFVTLVGILDADMSLHFPDYRSNERTFQLVCQVAGRSGRAEEKGEVVLQTYDPENFILRFAKEYDYHGFYEREITVRAATMFPPFAKIVRVMVSGEDEKETLAALKDVYTKLQTVYCSHADDFLFFNRMHAPVKRIQKKFRYQVLMRLTNPEILKEIYDAATAVKYKNVLVYVEENPVNLS